MTKKIFLITLFIFAAWTCSNAAETAQSVLKHVVDRMSNEPVEAKFAITASGVSQDGTLTLSGSKFVVKTQDLSTWYDGKTQWTLSAATNEVNVTEPTKEELAEINPLLILGSLSSNFNAEMGKSMTGAYEILLAARSNDSGIASATVKVNSSTWFPTSINILTATGERFSIAIKSIKNIKKADDNTFRFNPAAHRGVEVIDLR